jgi:hypothetical protein
MTDKLQGTCSVCLRVIQLRGESPIRHGFSAVGIRHGQHGGWHTGPCPGVDFPHLGISSAGTSWALEKASAKLSNVRAELARLASHPDLTWYPTKSRGLPDFSRPFVLKHDEPSYQDLSPAQRDQYLARSRIGCPTYDSLHRRMTVEQQNQESSLEKTVAEYERVIETWSADKYPTTGAAAKVATVHMKHTVKHSSGATWDRALCSSSRRSRFSGALKTDDPSKVTCQRCKKALGLPT